MGIGFLRIVDRDCVSRSDLHRQYLYDARSLRRPKAEAAAERLENLNPDVEIDAVPEALTSRNADDLIEGMDVVVDGLDRPEPRYLINRTCLGKKVPYVFAAAVESYGNAATLVPGRGACLECFMGGLTEEDLPLCGVVGVHPSVLALISGVQVSEAVRILTGMEPHLLNRLYYADLRNFDFNVMDLATLPGCPVCSGEGGVPQAPEEKLLHEGCGRNGRRTFFLSPRERLNFDRGTLERELKGRGYAIHSSGPLGISFDTPEGWKCCLLMGGAMNGQAPEGAEEPGSSILEIYRSLLVDGLGVYPALLPEGGS
jgi:adenylyltransferase/sulfurtransferase